MEGKRSEKAAMAQANMQKQLVDEKVARSSAVPQMSRMVKSTAAKRPANTYALPSQTYPR